MAKQAPNTTIDAMLNQVALSTRLTVLSAEPANFAGIAAVLLASVVLTAGDGNGDFVVGDGDTSGRKVAIAQQTGVSIASSGDATHVGLDDGTTLHYVTTCTTQTLTAGGTVTSPTWDIEVADPA